MKIIRICLQIAILWIFYFIGDLIVNLLHIKFPGSIIGLILLWAALYFKLLNIKFVLDGASFLITFLTLFFIPSTVGIIQYPELLTAKGMLLIIAVFVSSIFAFVLTGKFAGYIEKLELRKEGDKIE
jgi:holin-like protein